MTKSIIIPIYLRAKRPEELHDLEGMKLARRAIESLKIMEDQDFTLVLPVCLDMSGEEEEGPLFQMDRLVREEIERLKKENTLVFSSCHLRRLREYLEQRGLRNFNPLIDLKGYSKIRNTGLLLAQATSTEVALFVDSDEVVEDPDFLTIACEFLNERVNGKLLRGKGGFYLNADGNILLSPQRFWWKFLWNKTKSMNRVWERILSAQDRLVPSPILLGGNLALHRTLFNRIPFDPYIPRGEDTDYLINARKLGYCLLFDKELRIKHLPPERTEVYSQEELRGDVERFLYERKKIRVGPSMDLDPYPGYFLKWTLYPRAILTSFLLGLDYLGKGKWKKAGECLENLHLIFQTPDNGWIKYLKFRADWEKAMEIIQKEGINEILENCWLKG